MPTRHRVRTVDDSAIAPRSRDSRPEHAGGCRVQRRLPLRRAGLASYRRPRSCYARRRRLRTPARRARAPMSRSIPRPPEISVVVPLLDEQENVGELHRRIAAGARSPGRRGRDRPRRRRQPRRHGAADRRSGRGRPRVVAIHLSAQLRPPGGRHGGDRPRPGRGRGRDGRRRAGPAGADRRDGPALADGQRGGLRGPDASQGSLPKRVGLCGVLSPPGRDLATTRSPATRATSA